MVKTARRIALIAAVSLGLVGAPPAVQADHQVTGEHESTPTPPVPPSEPDGMCLLWSNEVYESGRDNSLVASGSNHGHFLKSGDAFADCYSLTQEGEPFFGSNDFGAFREFHFPFAAGTDGPGECERLPPGDNCEGHGAHRDAGWSHSSCYAEAPGDDPDCDFSFFDGWSSGPASILGSTPFYGGTAAVDDTDGDGDPDACVNCGEVTMQGLSFWTYSGFWNSDWPVSDPNDSERGHPGATDNFVKFCRGVYDLNGDGVPDCSNVVAGGASESTGGGHVLAWGALTHWSSDDERWGLDEDEDGSPDVVCFLADLTYDPFHLWGESAWPMQGVAQMWWTGGDEGPAACDGESASLL